MKLNLERHCIETAARREYRRLLYSLQQLDESSVRFRENANLLEQMEKFLRLTDFSKLRTQRPELAGGRAWEVELRPGDSPGKFELVVTRGGR